MTIDEQVEKIYKRMFRRRLDAYNPLQLQGWQEADFSTPWCKRKPEDVIREHLEQGHRVTAGWYSTRVRDYHRNVILWKEKAK